jgi:hypothetical protein
LRILIATEVDPATITDHTIAVTTTEIVVTPPPLHAP